MAVQPVLVFKHATDVIIVSAQQTLPAALSAFTLCLWMITPPLRRPYSQRAILSLLPDEHVEGFSISILPKHIIFSIAGSHLLTKYKVGFFHLISMCKHSK